MLAKSGDSLMDNDTKQNLQHTLLPLADVVTPNLPEAEEITGLTIDSEEKLCRLAASLLIGLVVKVSSLKAVIQMILI